MTVKTAIKIGVGLLIILFLAIGYRSCRDLIILGAKNKELKAQYEAMKKSTQSDKVVSDKVISDQEKKIADLDTKNKEHQATIASLKKKLIPLDQTTSALEAARKTLTNKDDIIANLDQQVAAWKQKFTLAQDIIAEKDAIIFGLTDKYEAQVKISAELRKEYTGEYNLRILAEQRIIVLEKSFKGLRITTGVTKGIAAILGGILIYSLVAK